MWCYISGSSSDLVLDQMVLQPQVCKDVDFLDFLILKWIFSAVPKYDFLQHKTLSHSSPLWHGSCWFSFPSLLPRTFLLAELRSGVGSVAKIPKTQLYILFSSFFHWISDFQCVTWFWSILRIKYFVLVLYSQLFLDLSFWGGICWAPRFVICEVTHPPLSLSLY